MIEYINGKMNKWTESQVGDLMAPIFQMVQVLGWLKTRNNKSELRLASDLSYLLKQRVTVWIWSHCTSYFFLMLFQTSVFPKGLNNCIGMFWNICIEICCLSFLLEHVVLMSIQYPSNLFLLDLVVKAHN